MNMFFNIFIFILNLYNIKSLEISQVWQKNEEKYEIKDIAPNKIDSYAFEDETGEELYLLSNRTLLYNSKLVKIPEEFNNLTSIRNPLINYKNALYFCSSSQILMWIKDSQLYFKRNEKNITELNVNYTMKFLKGYDSILVAYLGTSYIFWFNGEEYYDSYLFKESRTILAINNFTSDDFSISNEYQYTSLSKDENNYYFNTFKKSVGGGIVDIDSKEKSIPIKEITIYDNIEIVTRHIGNTIFFLFSYDSISGDFSFYIIGLEQNLKYLDGKNYFRYFNDYKIKYAKFSEKFPLLYYAIEGRTNEQKSYIGLADLQYYLLLYNIEENFKDNLYLYFGTHFKYNGKLFYFSGNTKVSFCPFIEEENTHNCFYDFYDTSSYFDISKVGNYYQNSKKSNCNGKKSLNRYCFINCTNGYFDNGKFCELCDLLSDKLIFYKAQKCLPLSDCLKKNYINDTDNGICYDCADDTIDNRIIYYLNDCLDDCKKHFLEYDEENNTCISCKQQDKNYYFSIKNKKCIDKEKCEGEIDEYLNTCTECEFIENKKLFLPYNYSCVEKCGFLLEEKENKCLLCNNSLNEYYEEGKCVKDVCNRDKGYGFNNQIFLNYDVTYCMKCINNDSLSYLDGNNCSVTCGPNSLITSEKICISCEPNFYIERAEICLDKCPEGSSITNTYTCSFCGDNKYYYKGECISGCNSEQIVKTNNYTNNSIFIEYRECVDCKNKINGDECEECIGNFYSPSEEQCYECFCGSDFNCKELKGQCDCSANSSYYYGYSCEFYSEKDINEKEMKIVSINNRLIKTSSNYFTYELKENNTSLNKCLFEWKVFLRGTEITGDKNNKKFFITATNEEVFGMNKELFDYVKYFDDKIGLSLNINCKEREYYDIITLKLINSFEFDNKCVRGSSGDIGLHEMRTNFVLENEKRGNNRVNGSYLNQYLLLDYNNERMPITDYIQSDSININLICSRGFDINIKNDREEKQQSQFYSTTSCGKSNYKIDEILEGKFYKIEKIFLLISRLSNYETLDFNQFIQINDFINEVIPEIINEDGFWIESKNETKKNITYAEPKLIFSLINNLIYKSHNILKNEENMKYFFNFTENIFNEIFRDEKFSNNSLSDSDIKSLFRTIDNLYDLSIKNNLNSPLNINNFVTVFDDVTKCLSFKTYPSEIIRLIGNRISILNYHFGEHQNEISFPNINNMEEVEINNFLTYSYDDYFLNEKICTQKVGSFFCFSEDNYNNLMNKLCKSNYEINNMVLNIYLLQEINQNNEIFPNIDEDNYYDPEDTFEKITINKNYSIIYKLFKKEKNNLYLINDEDIDIELDVEFPFGINIQESEINLKEKNKKNKNIFSAEYYFDKKGWDIPLNPNNSDYACITKSFYDKNKKNDKYLCTTHFGYDVQKVRCSCKTKLNDEILIIKDKKLAQTFKHIQFKEDDIKLLNKSSLLIIYLFILLLLIPVIYFIIIEIIKETKIINEKKEILEIEDKNEELKKKYGQIKKYYDTGIFKFAFYLALKKFPLFLIFNDHGNKYPIFIKHMIIYIGFFIGIIFPLIVFYFIPFSEKQIFIDQRDIN